MDCPCPGFDPRTETKGFGVPHDESVPGGLLIREAGPDTAQGHIRSRVKGGPRKRRAWNPIGWFLWRKLSRDPRTLRAAFPWGRAGGEGAEDVTFEPRPARAFQGLLGAL